MQALERKRIIYKNLKNCYCVTKCIFKGNQPFDPGNLSPNKLHSSENWNTKRSFFVILGWGRASENIANCKGKGYTSQEKVKNEFTKTLNANIWWFFFCDFAHVINVSCMLKNVNVTWWTTMIIVVSNRFPLRLN